MISTQKPIYYIIHRSSRPKVFLKKTVLENFAKFTGKYHGWGLIFDKVSGLRPATLLKKRLRYRCFPVNYAKFLRALFLQNTSGRVLLYSDNSVVISPFLVVDRVQILLLVLR